MAGVWSSPLVGGLLLIILLVSSTGVLPAASSNADDGVSCQESSCPSNGEARLGHGQRRLYMAAGSNWYGQLGSQNNSGKSEANPLPLFVEDLEGEASTMAAGSEHTVFLMKDGSVFSVGANTFGQLAVVEGGKRPTRVVALGSNVSAISAGHYHTLFLLKNGSVFSAGLNKDGQLGNPSNFGSSRPNPTPQMVDVGAVLAVSAGSSHSLFLLRDGSVLAVGSNKNGQLGIATGSSGNAANPSPMPVGGLSGDVTALVAGGEHSLFHMESGSVYAAGLNNWGQLGVVTNFTETEINASPRLVDALGTNVSFVSGGNQHSLFLMKNGSVFAVGSNFNGQLGVKLNTRKFLANPNPLSVGALGMDVLSVAAGHYHSLFLLKNGSVLASGENRFGQLASENGAGFHAPHPEPLWVESLPVELFVSAVAGGGAHTAFLVQNREGQVLRTA
eukprot:TRINITY_DN73232_c0_g1_i1.p1 TRINITY_DN73232_c0_g1~~TRINITY_DN73232_c0_g1_i1.p1  ORF type:complete len:453 (-),score=78.28 TRINITY_DN73232_c0_g1_i1:115-1452(-)